MIGENIKKARKAKGFTQAELAAALNVVRQTVSKWETGASVPDADVLMEIAALLDTPVTGLLGLPPQTGDTEKLEVELARVNELLAAREREESFRRQAGKKRGLLLLLSFLAATVSIGMQNPLVSIALAAGFMFAASVILYRNLPLLTGTAVSAAKTGLLRRTTIFSILILLFTLAVVFLDEAAVIRLTESGEKLLAMGVTCAVMLAGGFIAPRLPFNRHIGLRLPWTVLDEETWNVAHSVTGHISLPLVLLYIAMSCTAGDFKAISTAVILLWVTVPGLISFVFWWKKYRGRP